VNARGEEVTDVEVITEPSVLYFGFTSCPDICPVDMARNGEAVAILEERGIAAQPVFISVDPERDTPEVVGEYASYFHPRAVGLTGSAEQVDAAAKAYRVYYAKQEGDAESYLVDHTGYSYLVLPGLGFVDFVNREDPPQELADRLACFVRAAEAA
jgi:protein SCO1/2